jgi:O-antigen ligase
VSAEARLRTRGEATTAGAPAFAAGVAAIALGAVAAYSPKTALEALLALGLVVLAICRLDLAVGVFILMTFPEHLPGTLGVGATLAKPVGALIALAWVGRVAAQRGVVPLLPRECPALFWAALGFVALGAMSALWATDPGSTFTDLSRIVQVVVLMLVAFTAAANRSGFRLILGSYLGASALTSLYSIGTGGYSQAGRLAGLFDPNYFAASLVPALLVCLFLLLAPGPRHHRGLVGAVAAIDLLAFVLTQSRGGLIGLAVALVAAVALAGAARPRVVAVVLVLFAAGLGYYTLAAPSHVTSSSSSGRAGEWRIALRMFGSRPLSGVGLGNFGVVEPSYSTKLLNLQRVRFVVNFRQRVHNTYLEVAAEEGIAGVLLLLAVFGLSLRYAGRSLPALARAPDSLEPWVRGLIAGAIGMFVAYFFLSAQWEKQLWIVLALLAAAPALVPAAEPEEPR